MTTPVLFLIFNRPETTKRVFEKIREAKPERLFVAADGPRPLVPTDASRCAAARAVIDQVDWDCRVIKLFREENLGCGKGVSQAITWFFEQVEEGIILEDDCLPDLSFFRYCQELLERYRNEQQVMHISGHSLISGKFYIADSYFFSHLATIWGWASWRRAWNKYRFKLTVEDVLQLESNLRRYNFSPNAIKSYRRHLHNSISSKVDTWDYQWLYAALANNGLAAIPNASLIENIGFDGEATHTKKRKKHLSTPSNSLDGELKHPDTLDVNPQTERQLMDILFPGLLKKKVRELLDIVLTQLKD